MSFVKGRLPEDEQHVLFQLGQLMQQIRDDLSTGGAPGLRPSHYRVLGHVPPDGVSITELAALVGMTKQGCGQFVTQLTDTGHLLVEPNPLDGRVRLVRRTPLGDEVTRDLVKRVGDLEDRWAAQVGRQRYDAFRSVLDEIADLD